MKMLAYRKLCIVLLAVALLMLVSKYMDRNSDTQDTSQVLVKDTVVLVKDTVQSKPSVHPFVVIVDTASDSAAPPFNCTTIKISGSTVPLCVYPPQDDVFIGKMLRTGYVSDAGYIAYMINCLKKDDRFQFIDLGAHLGLFTLPIAKMERHVLAVEPTWETVKRLSKSIYLGNMSKHVTLLHNAMLNVHETLSLSGDPTNRMDTRVGASTNCTKMDANLKCLSATVQTITVDDLLPLMKSDRAIMKVDIQEAEINTMIPATAGKFFAAIDVPVIFLEWAFFAQRYGNVQKRKEIDDWLNFFYDRNYTVHHDKSGALLGKDWQHWSYNVVFKKPYLSHGLL